MVSGVPLQTAVIIIAAEHIPPQVWPVFLSNNSLTARIYQQPILASCIGWDLSHYTPPSSRSMREFKVSTKFLIFFTVKNPSSLGAVFILHLQYLTKMCHHLLSRLTDEVRQYSLGCYQWVVRQRSPPRTSYFNKNIHILVACGLLISFYVVNRNVVNFAGGGTWEWRRW